MIWSISTTWHPYRSCILGAVCGSNDLRLEALVPAFRHTYFTKAHMCYSSYTAGPVNYASLCFLFYFPRHQQSWKGVWSKNSKTVSKHFALPARFREHCILGFHVGVRTSAIKNIICCPSRVENYARMILGTESRFASSDILQLRLHDGFESVVHAHIYMCSL